MKRIITLENLMNCFLIKKHEIIFYFGIIRNGRMCAFQNDLLQVAASTVNCDIVT